MKKIILPFLLTGLQATAQLSTGNFTVLTEPNGHTANIKAVKFTTDGKRIITASDDKTARVWDIDAGVLVKTLHGETDEANYGMLNSAAILPDNEIVALGGYLGPAESKQGTVRFMNYETGELLANAAGPKGSIVALDCAPNGKFLAGGTTNGEISLWNLGNMQQIDLSGHRDGVYGVAFSPDSRHMVTGSYDGTAIWWDLNILYDQTIPIAYKQLTNHTAEVRAVAFSPNGEWFATGGYDNRVLLYNKNGELVKELVKIADAQYGDNYGMGDIHALAFSDDGSRIAIGTSLSNNENVWVVDVSSGKKISSFSGHTNTVMALDFYGNDRVASAGGENRDIYVWNATSGKEIAGFRGVGKRVYAVEVSPDLKVAFGQTPNTGTERVVNGFGKCDQVFDLGNFNMQPYTPGADSKFTGAVTEHNELFLRASGVSALNVVNRSGEILQTIKLDASTDGDLRSYTYAPDGKIIIGTNYRILILDKDARRLRELNGHTSDVYALAVTGNLLVSGSADQSVKLWNLDDEGQYPMNHDEFKKYLENMGVDAQKLDAFLKEKNMTFEQLYHEYVQKIVKPMVTLFPAGDDWIVYTKDNYYATSKNGSRYVGFHVNQGAEKEALFYTFRQFDYQLNRPDKVLQVIGYENAKLISALEHAYVKRLKLSGYTVPDGNQLGDAPELKLKNRPDVVKTEKIKLNFDLKGKALNRVNVTVNGVPVNVAGSDLAMLFPGEGYNVMVYSCNFLLVNGKNEVNIWATNKSGVSSTVESFTVYYEPEKAAKPDLYVVSMGVSGYKQKDFDLTYAAKDAADVAKQFSAPGDIYNKVHQLVLTNEKVTANVTDEIQSFLAGAGINDRVIVFYAGHGLFDGDFNYYLASAETDFNNPAAKSIPYEKLEKALSGIGARNKLVMIDACHSGEVDKDELVAVNTQASNTGDVKFRNVGAKSVAYKSGLGMQQSFTLMKTMFADMNSQTGANIISSAGGVELAMESGEWKNGLFTYILLNGLKAKTADLNKDGGITVSEVNRFVRAEVNQRSGGRQVPTSRTENTGADFRLW